MDDYTPPYYMLPIINIIKGTLVQHANERLDSAIISEVSLNITEALEVFLSNNTRLICNVR